MKNKTKETKIEQQFFTKLDEKLEEIFPKTNQDHPEIPSEGNRSGAIVFNAFANIYLREALAQQKKEIIEMMKNVEFRKPRKNEDMSRYAEQQQGFLCFQETLINKLKL